MTARRVPPIVIARTLYRTFGIRGTVRRARFEARRRLGLFRGQASAGPRAFAGPDPRHQLYGPADAYVELEPCLRARVLSAAERVVSGWHHAYGGEWRAMPADAMAWRTDPVRGHTFDCTAWWRIPHLPSACDIKDVWEPGRFAWIYDLARAFALTGDERFRDAFTRYLQSWWASSPPFLGPHWSCGQETAIRALALLHAEAVLLPPGKKSATAQTVPEILWASGERIADAFEYGLSQRNNHGISESAALIHLGFRLKDCHPAARHWRRLGRRRLAEQIRDQFSADGWYAQHSFAYMRTALDQSVLAQRVLTHHGLSLPDDCLSRLRQSVALMAAAVCSETGALPNYGANDGGRVVTYSSAPYRDFRPALTLASVVLETALPVDVAPDPEVVAWLGARPAIGEARRDGAVTGSSGWAVARSGSVSVFVRAGEARHRPSHMDSLHLDVRYGPHEVITDPGTYSYNAPDPWHNGLVSADVHNGPFVNDREPGVRGPRFLWWAWPLAELGSVDSKDGNTTIEARLLDASSRLPIAERRVYVSRGSVRVEDRHRLEAPATVQVTWVLHPSAPETVRISVGLSGAEGAMPHMMQEIRGEEGHTAGWFSPTYGVREVTKTLRFRAPDINRETPVVTQIVLGDAS